MMSDGIVTNAPNIVRLLQSPGSSQLDPDVLQDRARGVLLGLAVGNLLGLPVEGNWYSYIDQLYPGGVTVINPAEARRPMDDDLAQAVDLGEALVEGGDCAAGFAGRLVIWMRENGRGIGYTTRAVIRLLEAGVELPEAARRIYESRGHIAPNGGVMRCAPVALARHGSPNILVRDSASTCAVTHYAPACQWSCIIINAAIAFLLQGVEPDLAALVEAAEADGTLDMAAKARNDGIPSVILDGIANRSDIPGGIEWLKCDQRLIGHTLLALEVGLWAMATPLTLEDALVAVVGAGGDTDTNAAVAGAVLGARYGASAIPQRWLDCVPQRERIEALADNLLRAEG